MRIPDYLRSTGFRIAIIYAIVFALSVGVLSYANLWSANRELESQLRFQINRESSFLQRTYELRGKQGLVDEVRERSENVRSDDAAYFLLDASGRVIEGNIGVTNLVDGWQELLIPRSPPEKPRQMVALGTKINDILLVVARSTHTLKEVREVLLHSFGWTLVLTLPLALMGAVLVGRATIRRMEQINHATREIMEGNLSRRLDLTGSKGEFDQLAGYINKMLDRIEELMSGVQQATTDIAHDLRTPLSRLRNDLESTRSGSQVAEEFRRGIDRAIEAADNILQIFSALLRIAEIESGTQRSRFTRVDLSGLAQHVCEAYETVAEDKMQRLAAGIEPGIGVLGDRDLLMQLMANLIENAITHCPPRTLIRIDVTRRSGHASLVVTDTGPGIPVAEREKVMRRFYRLERSRTTPGSGLGLPLVRAIATLHEAKLELSDATPGLCVQITFPLRLPPLGT
jgi:signal transduction histidine kinase